MIQFTEDDDFEKQDLGQLTYGQSITQAAPLVTNKISKKTPDTIPNVYLEGNNSSNPNHGIIKCTECSELIRQLSTYVVEENLKQYTENMNKTIDQIKLEDLKLNPLNLFEILSEEDQKVFIQWLKEGAINNTIPMSIANAETIEQLKPVPLQIEESTVQAFINKQDQYKARIPKINELLSTDILNNLLDQVSAKINELVDPTTIENITETYLNTVFKEQHFLDSFQITSIYSTPQDILKILTNNECTALLQRVKPYLEFVTEDLINDVSQIEEGGVLDYLLTNEEIKGILDKEIDLKNAVIQTLSYDEIVIMFNDFKQELFLNDFSVLIDEALEKYTIDEELLYAWIVQAHIKYKTI